MSYAYSVAIKLSVANLASQGLRLIVADMLKAHGIATSLQTKMSALKLAAVGYGLDRAGMGIFHGLEKTVSAAREYTSQLSLMNAAGMSQAEIANSIAAAWSTTKDVVTSTAAENLRQLRELRSLFGNQHMSEAYAILPSVMRTQAEMEALTGQRNEKIAFEMAKVAELRQTGVMTLPFLQRNIDELSRTLMAMGGTINANDFLMTMKYAKTAALSFSDQFVYQQLPTLIQEMKSSGGGMMGNASTAGTALATLYGAIVEGKIPKASIPLWMSLGLIKPADIVRNATGSFQIRPGGIEGVKLFQENPFFWAQMIAPQLERYSKEHHLNLTQVVMSMFGARNAQFMMNTLIAKAPQILRDQQLISSTPNTLESYNRLLKSNPLLADQALDSQWQNVLAILGYKVLPRLIPYMIKFADKLDALSQWFERHPNITSGLVIGLGVLAGALTIAGKVMMSAALIKFLGLGPALGKMFAGAWGLIANPIGLTILAIAGIGVAAYELWKHWNVVGPWLKGIWKDIASAATAAWSGIKSSMVSLTGWMREEWDRLTNWFHARPTSATLPQPSPAVLTWASSGAAPAQARDLVTVTAPAVHVHPAAATAPATVSYVVPRGPATTVVHTQVNMDGKKVAAATTRHIAGALAAPQTGPSIFDGRQALVPAGGI